jgi:hypothetical protein
MHFPVTVPYRTSPTMSQYTGPLYEPNGSYCEAKYIEFDKYGTDLYANRRADLVNLASKVLNIAPTDSIKELALHFREDIAILHKGVLEAICFCFPSSWVPSSKIGKSLTEIHEPVADGDALRKMTPRLTEMMSIQGPFRRYVWTISTTGELSNHPRVEKPVVTEDTNIDDLYFRMETQTTSPLGDGLSSLFLVLVETCPLNQLWDNIEYRQKILDSVDSMSDSVLQYKNLVDIKKILNKRTA